jgi:hypothetical protein
MVSRRDIDAHLSLVGRSLGPTVRPAFRGGVGGAGDFETTCGRPISLEM